MPTLSRMFIVSHSRVGYLVINYLVTPKLRREHRQTLRNIPKRWRVGLCQWFSQQMYWPPTRTSIKKRGGSAYVCLTSAKNHIYKPYDYRGGECPMSIASFEFTTSSDRSVVLCRRTPTVDEGVQYWGIPMITVDMKRRSAGVR